VRASHARTRVPGRAERPGAGGADRVVEVRVTVADVKPRGTSLPASGVPPARTAGARIVIGILTIGLFLVLGKLVGAFREMAIAYRYGTSGTVDAYVFVTSLYGWLPALLGGALTAVLVPLAKREAARGASTDTLLGELLGAALLLGTVVAVLAVVSAPATIDWLAGSDRQAAVELHRFVVELSPLLPIGMAVVPLTIALLARDRQSNTLFEAFPAAVVCMAVIAWPMASTSPLSIGHVAGIALQAIALTWALTATGHAPRPRLGFQAQQWPALGRAMGILLAGQCAMSAVTIVDQTIALAQGPGSLATFGYASRILALLTGLGVTVVARAMLPVLADLAAAGRTAEAVGLARRWAAIVTLGAASGAVVAAVFAPDIVRVLFRRGAFGEADVAAVSEVLRFSLVQLPFHLGGVVLVQLVVCQSRHVLVAVVAAASLLVKLAANHLLLPHFGLSGLMLGTAVMYAFSAAAFWIATSRSES
jgi:putative peptidoglycan lipid II flippase